MLSSFAAWCRFLKGRISRCGKSSGAFTLFETVLTLALSGMVMGILLIYTHRIFNLLSLSLESLRRSHEFRALYCFLVADCEELAFLRNQASLELTFSPSNLEEYSLTLWKRLSKEWKQVPLSQRQALHTVRYLFKPKTGIIAREVRGEMGSKASPEPLALFSRNLVRNVEDFQLYPLDALGQKQEQWTAGTSAGLECVITFRPFHRQPRQIFRAKIPVFRIGYEEPLDEVSAEEL